MSCPVGLFLALCNKADRPTIGEEDLLIEFFGNEYLQYRARTYVGIPFIP